MPKISRRNQNRRDTYRWKQRASDRRISIDCPRCHGKVGIPIDVFQNGVESDPDKQVTTVKMREGIPYKPALPDMEPTLALYSHRIGQVNPPNFICESCDYREGATSFRPG